MTLRALVLFLRAKLDQALTQAVEALKLDPDNCKAKELRSRIKEVVRLHDNGSEAFETKRYNVAVALWADALSVS